MNAVTPHPALLDAVLRIAIEAGEAIMQVYRGAFSITRKEDDSPLTEADMAAHRSIVAGLSALTPGLPILTEEGEVPDFATRQGWRQYWLVDPLDGTREFIKRNGEFTVNIALIDGYEAVLGVVHAPALAVSYAAARGLGAWKWQDEKPPVRITARPLPCEGALRIAGSRSHSNARMADFLARVGPHELISMGSALKSCLVAEGVADLYPRLGPTSEWDTAAAQCVVEEAGGQVTDTAMQRLRYNTKDSLLNPEFFVFGRHSRCWAEILPAL
ncbi:MAG: 3'(2'),5'-bisphosphate nucleotidase CysQ [Pseudomonadota bacterium]